MTMSEPTLNKKEMYILEMDALREGDILLTSEKSISSKMVRGATLGRFSHAILYVGHGSYIHSDAMGVHSANIQRLLFDAPSRVKVLRPSKSGSAAKASLYARSQIGKEYSIKEAIRTKVGTRTRKENKQFCSRLVAEAFDYAGDKIVGTPSYCSPDDIDRSPFFEEVLGVARIATEAEINFSKSFNPIQRQSEITNTILSEARRLTKSDVQSLEELTLFVISNPGYADRIVEIYEKSGYLTMWRFEIAKNPWRYDKELFIALPMPREQKRRLAKSEAESANKQIALYVHNYRAFEELGKRNSSSFVNMNLGLYNNLIKQMAARLKASEYVLNNT